MSATTSLPTSQTSRKRKSTSTSQLSASHIHEPPNSTSTPSNKLSRQDSFSPPPSPCPTKKQKLLTPEASFGQRFEQALRAQAETHSYECMLASNSFDISGEYGREGEGEGELGGEYQTQATIPIVAVPMGAAHETQVAQGDDRLRMDLDPDLGLGVEGEMGEGVDSEDTINAVLTAFTYRLAMLHVSISSLKRARRKVDGALATLSLNEGGREEESSLATNTNTGPLSNPVQLHLQKESESQRQAKARLHGLTQLLEMAQGHLADVLVEREALRDALDEDFGDAAGEHAEGVVQEAERELRRLVRRYEERLYKMLGALSPEAMRLTVAEMGGLRSGIE